MTTIAARWHAVAPHVQPDVVLTSLERWSVVRIRANPKVGIGAQ
jgi:hypothetical protein